MTIHKLSTSLVFTWFNHTRKQRIELYCIWTVQLIMKCLFAVVLYELGDRHTILLRDTDVNNTNLCMDTQASRDETKKTTNLNMSQKWLQSISSRMKFPSAEFSSCLAIACLHSCFAYCVITEDQRLDTETPPADRLNRSEGAQKCLYFDGVSWCVCCIWFNDSKMSVFIASVKDDYFSLLWRDFLRMRPAHFGVNPLQSLKKKLFSRNGRLFALFRIIG